MVQTRVGRSRVPVLATLVLFGVADGSSLAAPAFQSALKIVVIEGENAVNIIQQKTAVRPVVEIRDRNDLPVSGAVVRFSVGGQNATFAGGAQSVTVTTDATGRATVSALNPVRAGKYQIDVRAQSNGQTATTSIAQTNFMTAALAAQAAGTTASSGGAGGSGGAAAGGAGAGAAAGGLSTLAIVGIAGGVAAGVGTAVAASQAGSDSRPASNNAPVVSSVTATPSAGLQAVTSISFSAQASDRDNDSLTYAWDFGDGTSSTQSAPSKIYQSAGTFTVRLTVSDTRGGSVTGQTNVTIRSLTGAWVVTGDNGVYNLTQNGAAIGGNYAAVVTIPNPPFPTINITVSGPISGSVRSQAPQVTFTLSFSVQISGSTTTGTQMATLTLSTDLNSMTGTFTTTFPPSVGLPPGFQASGTGTMTRR